MEHTQAHSHKSFMRGITPPSQRFRKAVRDVSSTIDDEQRNALTKLRGQLTISRTDSQRRLELVEGEVAAHAELVDSAAKAFGTRDPTEDVQLLRDGLHDGFESLPSRSERVEQQRVRIVELGRQLTNSHEHRMQLLTAAAAATREKESERKAAIKDLLAKLLTDLSTVAYVGLTQSQVCVQRAALSCNEQLLANQVTISTLLSQLMQHEILLQREVVRRVHVLYGKTQGVMAESIQLWTQQLLASSAFHAPRSRIAMLLACASANDNIKGEVTQLLDGLKRVAKGLAVKREGAPKEAPGGTAKGGWLHNYISEHSQPVFDVTFESVAEEWVVAIELVLHHMQSAKATLVKHAEGVEAEMKNEMANVITFMVEDLSRVFTPSEEEKAQAKLVGPPFDSIAVDDKRINDNTLEAKRLVAPLQAAIEQESKWFVDELARHMADKAAALVTVLANGRGNLCVVTKEVTVALHRVAQDMCLHVRTYHVHQDELENDYKDNLRWIEEDYAKVEAELKRCGSADAATELCAKGLELLSRAEDLYRTHHENRVGGIPGFFAQLSTIATKSSKELCDGLSVMSMADAVKFNEQVAEEEAKERERQATAAKPGGKDKASKKDDAAPPAPPTPTPLRIPLESLTQFQSEDGTTFVVLEEELHFGKPHDPPPAQADAGQDRLSEAGASSNAAGALSAANSAAPSKSAKEGKNRDKGKNSKSAGDTTTEPSEVDGAAPTAPPAELNPFQKRMMGAFDPVFHEECLFSPSTMRSFIDALRPAILNWMSRLKSDCSAEGTTYSTAIKEMMDCRTNLLIRQHQRRAPNLQAQVYEVRVRELEDGFQTRTKHFAWLRSRIENAQSCAASAIEASSTSCAEALAQLTQARQALPRIATLSALDTHSRTFAELKRKTAVALEEKTHLAEEQCSKDIAAVIKECENYEQSDKLRAFDAGGVLAPEERESALKQLAFIRQEAQDCAASTTSRVKTLLETQKKSSEEEGVKYQQQLELNIDEIKFFAEMQEIFAGVKGRISNQIAVSTNSETRIDEILAELEKLLAVSSPRDDGGWTAELLSRDYEAGGGRPHPDVEVSGEWVHDDEALSTLLRKTKADCEVVAKKSKPVAILSALDDLRKQLYSRGTFLGCLQFSTEFVPLSADAFLEPRKDSDAITPSLQNTTTIQNAKKTKGGAAASASPAKGQAQSQAGAATPQATTTRAASDGASLADEPAAWNKFMRVLSGETETGKWTASAREQLTAVAQRYFQKHAPPLLRPGVLGALVADVTETINSRLKDQEARTKTHILEATIKFRQQVQRAHLAVHRVSQEAFIGVCNLALNALERRCVDVFGVFDAFYCSMVSAKRHHGTVMKAGLAAPSNRAQLDALTQQELFRQTAAAKFIAKYHAIVLREIQDEASGLAARACQLLLTLFTMAKSLLTPDHVVPGEEVVVGTHKGLKRLMRQKAKEEMARQLEGGTLPAQSDKKAAGKADAKKAPAENAAKKKEEKGKAKAKDAKEEDEFVQLPLLEKPPQEYAGVVVNAVQVFHDYKVQHPQIVLKPHHLPPQMWEQVARPTSADSTKDEPAKKGAKPAKAPVASQPAAHAKPTNTAQTPEVPTEPPVEPIVSAPLSAPKERLFQSAVLGRQQAIEAFDKFCVSFAERAGAKFTRLVECETDWKTSWDAAVAALIHVDLKPPQAVKPVEEAPEAATKGKPAPKASKK